MADVNHKVILVISNQGYRHKIMEVAKANGARGGTVIHAKGTADAETQKFLNVLIQPEKEIILIVVPSELTEKIMSAISENLGTHTKVRALTIALPVTDLVGFAF